MNIYGTYVGAKKIVRENKEEDYKTFLMAALLSAESDGIDLSVVLRELPNIKQAKTMLELGFENEQVS